MPAPLWHHRLAAVLLAAALLAPAAPGAAADIPHWATPSAAKLSTAMGWNAPADLDAPIPVIEWNRLVALLVGEEPGGADPKEQDAIGGLMKLTNYLFEEKGFAGNRSVLTPFVDGARVADFQQVLVAGAVSLGLVQGYPEGELHPGSPLTYAEAVTLLVRLADRYHLQPPSGKLGAMLAGLPPQPRGFAAGTGLRLPREQVFHAGWPVGTAGDAWWTINGAAYAADLPGAGAAPEGHLWVVADMELYNWDRSELVIGPGDLRFTLEGSPGTEGLAGYPVNPTASDALGSPFGKGEVRLKQGESIRGFVVFAAPAGTARLWIRCESKLGLAPGKPGWNSMSRTPLGGSLPGARGK